MTFGGCDVQEAIEQQCASTAGEIHDSLLPYLFATRMRLEKLLERFDPGPGEASVQPNSNKIIAEEISQAIHSVQEAMTIGRRLIGELHPPDLVQVSWAEEMTLSAQRFGAECQPQLSLIGDFDDLTDDISLQLAARRIAQESISNAIRHGQAKSIEVVVRKLGSGQVALDVIDDGKGFDSARATQGFGLRIMHLRATSVGGAFAFESKKGGPTRVSFRCDAYDAAAAD